MLVTRTIPTAYHEKFNVIDNQLRRTWWIKQLSWLLGHNHHVYSWEIKWNRPDQLVCFGGNVFPSGKIIISSG